MTDKNKEIIVKLVAEGKNSYADFRNAIHNLSEWEVQGITTSTAWNPNITILYKISGNKDSKTIQLSDRFSLNERGQNLLYQLQKEDKMEALAVQSHLLNVKIFRLTLIGLILSLIALLGQYGPTIWQYLQL